MFNVTITSNELSELPIVFSLVIDPVKSSAWNDSKGKGKHIRYRLREGSRIAGDTVSTHKTTQVLVLHSSPCIHHIEEATEMVTISNHIDNIISMVCLLWHQSLSARDVKTCVFKFQILVTNIGIGGMGGWSIISCLQVNWTGMRFMSVTLCESERARGGRACSHDVTVSTFGCHERDNSICCCILRFIDLDNKTPHSKRIHKKSLLPPVVKRELRTTASFRVSYIESKRLHIFIGSSPSSWISSFHKWGEIHQGRVSWGHAQVLYIATRVRNSRKPFCTKGCELFHCCRFDFEASQ